MNPIETAVFPLKAMAVEAAQARAEERIAEVLADLEAHGWDLKKAAPYPRSTMARAPYKQAVAKYNLYQSLTMWTKSSLSRNEPDIRVRSPEAEAKFIKMFKDSAAASYDAYVAKLNGKIGECAEASLVALGGVWGHSELRVVTAAGERQTWRTQMILNCSALGTLFNQWPTRMVK